MDLAYVPLIAGVGGIGFAAYLAMSAMRAEKGTKQMQDISGAIQEGAMAFLMREYKTVGIFAVIIALILSFAINWQSGVGFIIGALFSASAGFIGMSITTRGNMRVANKAKEGVPQALALSFRCGAVTGMCVASLSLLGLSIFYIWFGDPTLMVGFGFGACLMSLFARIGGGIYTKAADVGADLVGKVEKGIPEDDPRNPAVIADQVGDNVGDCAGMGADLFETYAISAIGAMLLGWFLYDKNTDYIVFPLVLGAAAILASIIGSFFVKIKEGQGIMTGLYKGVIVAAIIAAICDFFVTKYIVGDMGLFWSALVGLVLAPVLFAITEYYTSDKYGPVKSIAEVSQSGPAINIITGYSIGLFSPGFAALAICAGIVGSFALAGGAPFFASSDVTSVAFYHGLYGIGITVMSMVSLTGMIIALDSYGPVTDNAGGIAEMSNLDPKTREVTDALDAVGNTTKAVTKSFAIGSAALAALTLFAAYMFEIWEEAPELGLTAFNIGDPLVIVGLLIGGLIPFLFCSRAIAAVGVAADSVIGEVRRQFREIKGLMEGTARPEYGKCVSIVTGAALKGMLFPALLAVLSPLAVGFLLGPKALGGLLMGCIITGLFLALQLSIGGAAWDNAKKYIEDGHFGGKGSPAHAAAVAGDTVGDPFKDTAGPAINPLIKVMNTVAILFAALIVTSHLIG
jgi:K(+)-stimulated pyrophosphate-energized sodium pump